MHVLQDAAYHDRIAHRFDAAYQKPDGHAYTAAFTRRILRIAPVESHHRVLDLGCGTGRFTHELARQSGAEVVGIDTSPEMVRLAQRHEGRGATFEHTPDGSIPFPARSFDLVFCFGVLHHAVGEGDPKLRTTLGEMARASKGRVLAIEPNLWNPYFFATTYLWHGLQERVAGYPRVAHERPLTAGFLRRAMRGAGLEVALTGHASPVEAYSNGKRPWAKRVESALEGRLHPFGTHVIALGYRP